MWSMLRRSAWIVPAWILLVFAAIGPLIGLVVFSFGMGGLALANGAADGAWLTPFFLLYGLIFAHYIGLPSALVAGAATALLGRLQPHLPLWIGTVGGLVSFALAYAGGAAFLPPQTDASILDSLRGIPGGFTVVVLLVHVLAALTSWGIARRWLKRKKSGPRQGLLKQGTDRHP